MGEELFYACREGNEVKTKKLLAHAGKQALKWHDDYGWTACIAAADGGLVW